jgi:hypothetical protein
VFCLRQFGDVERSVAERHQRFSAGKMIGSKNR